MKIEEPFVVFHWKLKSLKWWAKQLKYVFMYSYRLDILVLYSNCKCVIINCLDFQRCIENECEHSSTLSNKPSSMEHIEEKNMMMMMMKAYDWFEFLCVSVDFDESGFVLTWWITQNDNEQFQTYENPTYNNIN